jgi:hypothetical protein
MVDEINRGYINPKDKLYQLKALQESNKQIEVSSYLENQNKTYFFTIHPYLPQLIILFRIVSIFCVDI